jgi:pantoate--beta-alanine ligase
MVQLVHDPAAFRDACDRLRAQGERVGLVPTMGALHEGHLALVDEAKAKGATAVVVTIFVNPKQFDRDDDLRRYPRTLDSDLEACEARGVSLVFAPEADAMYPEGFQTHVQVGALAEELEGTYRPGHFLGVTTIVAKLFILTGACVAVFGRKDYQQWRIIDRMTRDLGLPVTVVGHPIVREEDGLALSSRNQLLEDADRPRALAIARGLKAASAAWDAGERSAEALTALARAPIEADFDRIDYVRVIDPVTLEGLDGAVERALLVVAAHLGPVRLIDNLELGVDPPPTPG